MNVWIENPFDNLPGEGYRKQRFWLMAEAFARAGDRVVLWTADFNHTTKARRRLTERVDSPVELRLVPTPPYARNVGLRRVLSHRAYARGWLRLATAADEPRPDLIVASTPTVSGAEAALTLAHRFGAKCVIDVMDAWPETFERLAPPAVRPLARALLAPLAARARAVYREADVVTGVCERYRAVTGRDDYYLAYHGIERPAPRTPTHEPRITNHEPRTTNHEPRLVYAGNLGLTYDLGTVIRGVKELGARLDVAGAGAGEPKWRKLADDLGLGGAVTFHGYLGADELAVLLAACDIGVVPMPAESFVGIPYKFADYAAAGLSIVSSLGGESEELLRRHRCGAAYAPGDVAGFTAAVRALVASGPGDLKALADAFDATAIYDAYVRRVES